ncbi:hypothetical protein [Alloacidobacterium sp.]|uniref:hypothetical protein n=1 Tax=Alloacidobacterium sp. TaxID=2951999 RepID=UPI002D62864E|nr:hypothetical protein [Alloacidobacterium sp.]HYK37594.1 hypothetical protein [Alloacidobacterium sp.]
MLQLIAVLHEFVQGQRSLLKEDRVGRSETLRDLDKVFSSGTISGHMGALIQVFAIST